jgi:hypothetical protein
MPSLLSLLDPTTIGSILGGGGVLGFVGAKFHKLDVEVRECRRRDADVVIVMAGVQLLVGKMKRDDPGSVELQMFSDLMARRLGPPPSIDDFNSLLAQIDKADLERGKARDPD